MRSRLLAGLALMATGVVVVADCQSYPFETRAGKAVQGHLVTQSVVNLTPTDILFVVDNSGSMFTARSELGKNMSAFVQQMSQSGADFQVGIVTTDVDCNIPERDCGSSGTNGPTAWSCCLIAQNANLPMCQDLDLNGDGKIDWSSCDAGRLRAPRGKPPIWRVPAAAQQTAWAQDFNQQIMALGCNGSGLESGLEAARRAVNCSVYGYDATQPQRCPSPAVAQLNAGFIRPDADLVVIFVTDEDDCSFVDPTKYQQPANSDTAAAQADPGNQAAHLCTMQECYAYYGAAIDQNGNGVQDWAESSSNLYKCGLGSAQVPRSVNPPYPDDVSTFLSQLVAAKGGDVKRVRAAGILSGVASPTAPLGFQADACVGTALGVTNGCGCWSASAVNPSPSVPNFYCALTQFLGHGATPNPNNTVPNECSAIADSSAPLPGCKGMPGGRYAQFLQALADQRAAAEVSRDILADSICQAHYDQTMFSIVNTIILTSCFKLGSVPASADAVSVSLNHVGLPNVPVGSTSPGWSWVPGSQQICLEGGLKKTINDEFDIFVIDTVSSQGVQGG